MPKISLVVCVFKQGDLLRHLLLQAQGLYDDLVVVHDGLDETNIRAMMEAIGGRFFERPREKQQEPHWPFAWEQAAHDWILRLDADEVPSDEMKVWLQEFRAGPKTEDSISGFTCIWPLWNGHCAVSKRWPAGRHFLFHRKRVRFFGMVEQVPVADGRYEPLELVLHHQPARRSYGLRNVLMRKQAYLWRECIVRSLLGKPTDLFCWRWESECWPETWEQMRSRPLRTALAGLVMGTLRGLRDQWRLERRVFPMAAISGPLHHALICLEFRRLRQQQQRTASAKQRSANS